MTKIGTLAEIGAKPGDVVEFQGGARPIYTIGVSIYGKLIDVDDGGELCEYMPFRIVSRASDKPKLWRDMTPEEKSELLLAHHEGKDIEIRLGTLERGEWRVTCHPWWQSGNAYRIKPEPKVETVTTHGTWCNKGKMPKTQYVYEITFNLIDGKPDWNTAKVVGK